MDSNAEIPGIRDLNDENQRIADKIFRKQRLSPEEGLRLYQFPPGILSYLAESICQEKHGDKVYYVRNFHLEPTNICAYHCRFCSYSRKEAGDGAWEMTEADILRILMEQDPDAAEIHITGGAHPRYGLDDYLSVLKTVRTVRPGIHIKAFSAVEIFYLSTQSGIPAGSILQLMKENGLDSLPGGGAEIFDPEIRLKICPEKADGDTWLSIHEQAHKMGIPSNATMLYGHLESLHHRISHMTLLRELQDRSGGFNAFIPLKFRNRNNALSQLRECSLKDDLINFAVARIYLDNFSHIKAYWPMLGADHAALSLHFGADDLDGTIADSTSIYRMAGVNQTPSMSVEDIREMITAEGKQAVERDALYQPR